LNDMKISGKLEIINPELNLQEGNGDGIISIKITKFLQIYCLL